MTFSRPIRFLPIYQSRVWGGRRMDLLPGHALPDPITPFGEAWMISDRAEAQSTTVEGMTLHELWTRHRVEVFGAHTPDTLRFPLLMKILDAREELSIQVHPPASVAARLNGESKTEMWYLAHAEPGAKIYAGLKPGVTRAVFEQALGDSTVAAHVHEIAANTGDCLFIPSGRVHAIGAGLFIYEIQQNSDTTYRVFDWNRVGLDGAPRALHVQESLESIDFSDHAPQMQSAGDDGLLVSCAHFEVRHCERSGAVGKQGECVTLAVVEGEICVGSTVLQAGDFALVPACLDAAAREVCLSARGGRWLEVRLPA